MSIEYAAVLILLIVSIICSVISIIAVRSASRASLKQYNHHTTRLKAAQHAVEADIHKGVSDQLEKVVASTLEAIKKDLHATSEALIHRIESDVANAIQRELKVVNEAADAVSRSSRQTVETLEATAAKMQQGVLKDLQTQREQATQTIQDRIETEVARRSDHLESEMTRIVTAYTHQAFVNVANTDDQVEYILEELGRHKQAIAEDIRRAA